MKRADKRPHVRTALKLKAAPSRLPNHLCVTSYGKITSPGPPQESRLLTQMPLALVKSVLRQVLALLATLFGPLD